MKKKEEMVNQLKKKEMRISAFILSIILFLSLCRIPTIMSKAEENQNYNGKEIPSSAVTFNGHSYYLYPNTTSDWNDAKEHCESVGGYLAVISSSEENSFLYNYIQENANGNAYFGYTDEETEGDWKWIGKEDSTFSNWSDGEPNNQGNEHYGMFYYRSPAEKWNDGDFWGYSYICEWNYSLPPKINFKYSSSKTSEYEVLTAEYSDSFFSKTSYNYNHKLAWLSLCLELSSWTVNEKENWGENGEDDSDVAKERYSYISDAYTKMGFQDAEYHNYGKSLNTSTDKTAYSFAKKTIGEDTVIAVTIRGGGYGCEWTSNFNVGNGSYHTGFNTSAEEIYRNVLNYTSNISGNKKFWITGYSRGAAVANLVAAKLDDYAQNSSSVDNEGIFAYTFATPQGVTDAKNTNDSKYDNIFNIVSTIDPVTNVAPSAWKFTRFGETKYFNMNAGKELINSVSKKRKRISGDSWDIYASRNQDSVIASLLGLVLGEFPTSKSSGEIQKVIKDIVTWAYTCRKTDGKWSTISIDDYYSILYEKYGNDIMVNHQKADAFFKSTDVGVLLMSLDSIKDNEECQKLLKLLVTICYQNGMDYDRMYSVLNGIANNTELVPALFNIMTGLRVNGKFSTDGFKKAHEPYTYLAWMSLDENKIFTEEFNVDSSCYTSTASDYENNYNNLLNQDSGWTQYSSYRKTILENKSTVIPGYKQTNMANGNICNTMVPQGVCRAGDYILISAYDSRKQNNSVIYVMNKDSREYITTLVLSGHKSHVGALTYNNTNQTVYIVDSSNVGNYKIRMLPMSLINRAVAKKKDASFVTVNESFSLRKKKPSFITYYQNKIFIGTIGKSENGVDTPCIVTAYEADGNHSKIVDFKLPTNAQGVSFVDYKGKTYLLCSSSYGRKNPSKLYISEVAISDTKNYVLLEPTDTVLPNMSEDIDVADNKIYIAYEAAAKKYSTGTEDNQGVCRYPIDRVIASSLTTMMKENLSKAKRQAAPKSLRKSPDGNENNLPEGVLMEGKCGDNLTFVLYSDGVLDINGYGSMTDFDTDESVPWYEYRTDITSICIGADVLNIGTNAFAGCSNLTKLIISKFSNPDEVFAFHSMGFNGCNLFSEIVLPDKTYDIAEDAFGDTDLSKITVKGGSEEFLAFMRAHNAKSHEHDFQFDSTLDPTCSLSGYDKYICSECGEVSFRNITEATGEHDYQLIDSMEATCSSEGCEWYECANCGCSKKNTIPAVEHTFDQGVVESESTCLIHGEKVYTCETCGYRKTEYLELTDHIPLNPVQENRIEATEEEEGSYEEVIYCEECGEELSRNTIPIDSDNLKYAKTEAKEELEYYLDADAYRDEQKIELSTAIEVGKEEIDKAKTVLQVEEALNKAKRTLDAIKTDEEMTEEEERQQQDQEEANRITELIKQMNPEDESNVESVRQAYYDLTEEQKKLISAEDLNELDEAVIRIYESKISLLLNKEEISLEDEYDIIEARNLYNSLTEREQLKFSSELLQSLENAEIRIVELKIVRIADIETINLYDEDDIIDARDSYECLSKSQQSQISSELLQSLINAEIRIVRLKIAALQDTDNLSLDDDYDINRARELYESLSEDQKSEVPSEDLKSLENAEKKRVELLIERFSDVDSISLYDEYDIVRTRELYDSLTETQKAGIDPELLFLLENAEIRILELKIVSLFDEEYISYWDIWEINEISEAFDSLTNIQKERISTENQNKLSDLQKIANVLGKISDAHWSNPDSVRDARKE